MTNSRMFHRVGPALVVAAALTGPISGCHGDAPRDVGSDSGTGSTDDPDTTDSERLVVEMPAVTAEPGVEQDYCYHFQFGNSEDALVSGWESSFSGAVTSVEVLATETEQRPAGTLETGPCGLSTVIGATPAFLYRLTQAEGGWRFPTDDGTGLPMGKPVQAGLFGILLVHVANATADPVQSQATFTTLLYPPGTVGTHAEPYYTFAADLSIAPFSSTTYEVGCPMPEPGARFVHMEMSAFKLADRLTILDGTQKVYDTLDSSMPLQLSFPPPFYTFSAPEMTIHCEYINPGPSLVESGSSQLFDENCVSLSYYFPATRSQFCYNDALVPF